MTRRGKGRAVTLAACMALGAFIPAVGAHAQVLDEVTDPIDQTVDSVSSDTDQTVDTTETVVDETAEDTENLLDESVEDSSDLVDTTSDDLTEIVNETAEDVPTTQADDGTEFVDGGDSTTTSGDLSDTTAGETSIVPATEALADETLDADEEYQAFDQGDVEEANAGSASSSDDEVMIEADRLTVLSAAGGLTDLTVLETVSIAAITDDSIYGRLLEWLAGAGPGLAGVLAGPLLAVEIFLRALLSAGSGMVAPASLLGSYLLRLVWEGRFRRVPSPA